MRELVVSVVVPIYNGAMYVDALVQMIKNYFQEANKAMGRNEEDLFLAELILIDDGSKDDTYERCMKQASQYPWIHFIHTENRGVSHARNLGIDAAKGKWIQFLDADDVIETKMFQAFYALDADLLVCGCKRVHGNSRAVLCGPKEDAILSGLPMKQFYDQLRMEDRYWLLDYCWNKWYKKSILEAHTIRFDESMSLGEDFVFNVKYMQWIFSIGVRKHCYYQYRVGDTGLVSRFQKEPWIGRKKQYEAQKALYQSMGLWETNAAEICRQYGQIAFGDLRMVNSPACDLCVKEKKQFISNLIDSCMYDWITCYLKSRNSKAFRIYAFAWTRKDTALLFAFIQAEKGKISIEKLRHAYHVKKDLKIKKERMPVIAENKRKLTQSTGTILSQNCVGGVFYHDMGLEFLSPTINLFFEAEDFVKFVNNLAYYLSLEMEMSLDREYPVGILGDINVHFYHYATADEAKAAWERRKKRVDYHKILVLTTDRDGFTRETFAKWCEISYPKILFTAQSEYEGHPDVIYYPEFEKDGCVTNDLIEKRLFYRANKLIERMNHS